MRAHDTVSQATVRSSDCVLPAQVCALLVTYANRAELASQVAESLISQGVGGVLIVDNASAEPSVRKLTALMEAHQPVVRVLRVPENTGSAGGFRAGLMQLETEARFTHAWLLDDDNKPVPGALAALLGRATALERESSRIYALTCCRPDRAYHRLLAAGEAPASIFHRKSSFVGIHVVDMIQRRLQKLGLFAGRRQPLTDGDARLPMAPYGGLFLSMATLRQIGFPDPSYFVYVDDIDFTHRIGSRGGEIIFVKDAIIEDIDPTWRHAEPNASIVRALVMSGETLRVYYHLRNSTYWFGRNWSTSKLVFRFHEYLFVATAFAVAVVTGRIKRFRLITRAIRDGNAGRLGIRPPSFFAAYE